MILWNTICCWQRKIILMQFDWHEVLWQNPAVLSITSWFPTLLLLLQKQIYAPTQKSSHWLEATSKICSLETITSRWDRKSMKKYTKRWAYQVADWPELAQILIILEYFDLIFLFVLFQAPIHGLIRELKGFIPQESLSGMLGFLQQLLPLLTFFFGSFAPYWRK